jgi:hypothetical protein
MQSKKEIKERRHKYYEKNKKHINIKARECYESHKKERKIYEKEYRTNHKKETKEYILKNKEHIRKKDKNWHLIQKFGITLEQYNEMLTKQNDCCAICGRHKSELKKALAVDHNHETLKIRGLLCEKCNRGIGYLCDDINLLKKAIKFLKKNN